LTVLNFDHNPPYGPTRYGEGFLAYVFSSLPSLLPKASPLKDLAAILQNHEIPSYMQQYEYNSEGTVEAIKAYILVCLFVTYMSN